MDENDIIFIDDDERNGAPRDHRVDHRSRPSSRTLGMRRPRRVVIQTGNREPVVVQDAAPVMYPPQPSYPMTDRRLFGNLTASEAVEVAAQILASLAPLPVAPTATGRVETDVENLTMFHNAVAMHFKRDEQLRTIGSLLAKLMS